MRSLKNQMGILSRRTLPFFLILLLALSSSTPSGSQTAGRQQLQGHVPKAVATAKKAGEFTGKEKMVLAIGLPSRDPQGLDDFLKQLYDPKSSQYHRFLKKGQFAEKFGASSKDYQAVSDFAKANGLEVMHSHSSRTILIVSGSVADIQKAFHVNLHYYKRADGTKFYAPDREPSVDLDIPLLHVTGLDNSVPPHRGKFKKTPLAQLKRTGKKRGLKAGPQSVLGSGPSGEYIAADFRNAFAPNVAVNGAGQTLALFELEGYNSADILQYENEAGIAPVPVTNILIDGVDGSAQSGGPPPYNNDVEISMDIELAIGMAPGLSQVRVYEGYPNIFPVDSISVYPDDVLSTIADDDTAQEISCSYSFYAESTTELILEQMAAQGESFFVSSGDEGAYDSTICPPICNSIQDEIYVTSVGGTTLTMGGNGASYSSESAWPGSGGGYSADYTIPFFQTGLDMTTNGGSTSQRNYPDVAMPAQTIYVIATLFPPGENPALGTPFDSGGTSASSPLWAGYMALINQHRALNGLGPLGFADPALYALGQGPDYHADFHDITSGNNNDGSGVSYQAVPGYDLVTGWGSPAGLTLINDLCPGCPPMSPAPPTPTPTSAPPTATPTAAPCLSLIGRFTGINLNPAGLALDGAGNLYVAQEDVTPGVVRFTASGGPLSILYGNGSGTGPGQFHAPFGVALDASGDVFATDIDNQLALKFDPYGNFLASFGNATFAFPEGIVCDPSGNVYVSDYDEDQVYKFDNGGNPIGTVGSGLFTHPAGLAEDASGNLYVMDEGASHIDKFGPTGSPITQWGSPGSGPGQFTSPTYDNLNQLCVAGPGLLFAVDSANDRVEIFNPTGTFLGQIAGYGMVEPFGVAGNATRLYVSDNSNANSCVYIFDLTRCPAAPLTPAPTPTGSVTPTLIFTRTSTPTVTSTPTLPCVPGGAVWNPDTTMAGFSGRADFTSVVYGNQMWVVGGESQNPAGPQDGNVTTADVWSSLNGTAWNPVTPDGGFPAREGANLVVFDPGDGMGARMYLLGGFNPFTATPNTVYNDIYTSFNGVTWNPVTTNAPFPARVGAACTVFRGRLWVMGGGGYDDVWSSADGVKWVQNVQHVPGFLAGVSDVVVLNGQMWAMSQSNQGTSTNRFWSSPDGYTWTEGSAFFPARDNFALLSYAGELWVIGGTAGTERFGDVWHSATPFVSWTPVPGTEPFAPRGLSRGGLVFLDQMWILGGALGPAVPGGATIFANDVWNTLCGPGGGMHGIAPGRKFNEIISLQVPHGGTRRANLTVTLPAYTTLVFSSLRPSSILGPKLGFDLGGLPMGTNQIVLTLAVKRSAPLGASLVSQALAEGMGKLIPCRVSPPSYEVVKARPILRPHPNQPGTGARLNK